MQIVLEWYLTSDRNHDPNTFSFCTRNRSSSNGKAPPMSVHLSVNFESRYSLSHQTRPSCILPVDRVWTSFTTVLSEEVSSLFIRDFTVPLLTRSFRKPPSQRSFVVHVSKFTNFTVHWNPWELLNPNHLNLNLQSHPPTTTLLSISVSPFIPRTPSTILKCKIGLELSIDRILS